MKKMILTMMLMLMSMIASMPASASTTKKEVNKVLPENIIVKQSTRFNDGRVLTLYYKKRGQQCEIYSPCKDKDYVMSDASKIKSTNFEIVEKTEGKLLRKATLAEVLKIAKELLAQYL